MLIPRLNSMLSAGAFDPYSASQIPHLTDMAEQLEVYVGSDNIRYLVRYILGTKENQIIYLSLVFFDLSCTDFPESRNGINRTVPCIHFTVSCLEGSIIFRPWNNTCKEEVYESDEEAYR